MFIVLTTIYKTYLICAQYVYYMFYIQDLHYQSIVYLHFTNDRMNYLCTFDIDIIHFFSEHLKFDLKINCF